MIRNLKLKLEDDQFFTIVLMTLMLIGFTLRLIWPMDFEWKFDQAWMFDAGRYINETGKWPSLGMPSGGGIKNPALSVWFFAFLAKFSSTPLAMVQAIHWLNILSIVGFVLLIFKKIKKQKIIWLTGLTIASVSPLAILFSRNIWAQNVLAPFLLVCLIGFFYRHKFIGMFLFTLCGSLLGQIHMSGYFFFAPFLAMTVIYDLKLKNKVNWVGMLCGFIIPILFIIPWVKYLMDKPPVVSAQSEGNSGIIEFKHIFKFRYFTYWILDSLGIHLKYTFKKDFWNYVSHPIVGGVSTYLYGFFHIVCSAIGLFALSKFKLIINLAKDLFKFNKIDDPNLLLIIYFVVIGGFFTLVGLKLHPHYIIVIFPMTYIFMAYLLSKSRIITLVLIFSQSVISFGYLNFVHDGNTTEKSEFQIPYSLQNKNIKYFKKEFSPKDLEN